MTNQDMINAISKQCGFNKAKPYAVQVCNGGDWPTVEDQQAYWQDRDENLDRIESNAQWIDNKAKLELPF